ncbi:MAG: HAD-IIIA family hydrolase [Paludibacteraceae bacterium]
MFKEVVILAGGFGTRLSHVLGNVPKPMAPVYGKPFLAYVLSRLEQAGVEHVILATGYLHEVVENYFGNRYSSLRISYSREQQPLWTGGAIMAASQQIKADHFLVLNGDTLFDINFNALCQLHIAHSADISVALRYVEDTARYGAVEYTTSQQDEGRICAFEEKTSSNGAGWINGGIYAINRRWLQSLQMPQKFSFEKEMLQTMVKSIHIYGMPTDNYFIDIGVPEDYYRSQREFANLFPNDQNLFLDRDGVINVQVKGDYVRNWEMWQWLPNAAQIVAELSKSYIRTFVVTNQQGISKGLFTMADIDNIHSNMAAVIESYGGKIDHVYVCADLETAHSPNRKPAIGMARQAATDYSDVELTKSIMIGDSLSDIQFGWKAGMRCVYLHHNAPVPTEVRDYTDLLCTDLQEFADRHKMHKS